MLYIYYIYIYIILLYIIVINTQKLSSNFRQTSVKPVDERSYLTTTVIILIGVVHFRLHLKTYWLIYAGMKEKAYTTLMLDLDLNKRLKAIAARRGVSVRSMVHEALESLCHEYGHPDPELDRLAVLAGATRAGAADAAREVIEQYFKERDTK